MLKTDHDNSLDLSVRFPVGASITLDELDMDPYPAFRRLREQEPVSWIEAVGMYFVTRYEDVQTVLRDTDNYVVGTENSTLMDTLGVHMLTTEGELHDLYKNPLSSTVQDGRGPRGNGGIHCPACRVTDRWFRG